LKTGGRKGKAEVTQEKENRSTKKETRGRHICTWKLLADNLPNCFSVVISGVVPKSDSS
jgi:hypothetical protein